MRDHELVHAQQQIIDLTAKVERLEKHIEKINQRYLRAISDVQWYHRELRRYIKQAKITARRNEDENNGKR